MQQGKGSALLLRTARAKRKFWLEQRAAAVAADDSEGAATAQRFLDEYEAFISLLTGEIGAT